MWACVQTPVLLPATADALRGKWQFSRPAHMDPVSPGGSLMTSCIAGAFQPPNAPCARVPSNSLLPHFPADSLFPAFLRYLLLCAVSDCVCAAPPPSPRRLITTPLSAVHAVSETRSQRFWTDCCCLLITTSFFQIDSRLFAYTSLALYLQPNHAEPRRVGLHGR
jgi:hypothetical protein